MRRLEHYWYSDSRLPWLLLPLSALFYLISALRRLAYRLGLLASEQLPVPVIVVGNITVGGSGKTPLVVWLAEFLKQAGYRPGIISRGYGGQSEQWPVAVTTDSDPQRVGDEPLLIVQRSGCPMWVGPDRAEAARSLLHENAVDVIISDDGMQHYRLARDIEIAVVDGSRRFGNGFLLPAGPLREPVRRLAGCDLVVANGVARQGEFTMQLVPADAVSLQDGGKRPLNSFAESTVHAVAGIGEPQRFFTMLRQHGLDVIEHPFPDHHDYQAADIEFHDGLQLLMTEKDAVKCRKHARPYHWYIPVDAGLPARFGDEVLSLLKR